MHPAYHCLPKGGHGSFFPSGNLRLSCDRVFATEVLAGQWSRDRTGEEEFLSVHSAGYVIAVVYFGQPLVIVASRPVAIGPG